MGFDTAKMSNFTKVSEPVAPPTEMSKRTKVSIAGVTNSTVLSYMNLLNANDFDELIKLFAEDGALQPPFKRPIVGQDAILKFFKEECLNLKLAPEQGISEPAEDGYTQIEVTGKVQTPWFGAGVGMNMSWRFLLNSDNKIFLVAIACTFLKKKGKQQLAEFTFESERKRDDALRPLRDRGIMVSFYRDCSYFKIEAKSNTVRRTNTTSVNQVLV